MALPTLKSILSTGISSAVDSVTNGASKIIQDFKADPNKVLDTNIEMEKLKNEALKNADDYAVEMEQEFTKQQQAVSEEMQAEAKSEHWLVWSWRPCVGFTFILLIIYKFVISSIFKLPQIEVPGDVWTAILAILGVASLGRSATQWQREKNSQ